MRSPGDESIFEQWGKFPSEVKRTYSGLAVAVLLFGLLVLGSGCAWLPRTETYTTRDVRYEVCPEQKFENDCDPYVETDLPQTYRELMIRWTNDRANEACLAEVVRIWEGVWQECKDQWE